MFGCRERLFFCDGILIALYGISGLVATGLGVYKVFFIV